MKFSGNGYKISSVPTHEVSILGLNCVEKSTIRSSYEDVKDVFWHSGCYVFLKEPSEEKPGSIYVGQTRYFDTRFNAYHRLNEYEVVFLISKENSQKGDKQNFSEAEIQHLEFILIDAFKKLCFNRNYILENKQSGTATVGKPSAESNVNLIADAVLKVLTADFRFPLHANTPKRNSGLRVMTAGMDHKKGGKQYRLAVLHDEENHLFKVLKEYRGRQSQAIEADNAAYWHHKLIHQRLIEEGRVFKNKILSRKDLKCRGSDKRYDEFVYPLQDDWIAMNLSEIIGAFTNGPGPINWYDAESGELIKKSVIKTWNRGGPE
jgi:hypothetical protein